MPGHVCLTQYQLTVVAAKCFGPGITRVVSFVGRPQACQTLCFTWVSLPNSRLCCAEGVFFPSSDKSLLSMLPAVNFVKLPGFKLGGTMVPFFIFIALVRCPA